MPEPFDPASHRFGPSRYFEDFTVGETFHIPSRTVTEAQFLAFQAASGDNHPIHYDREFCRRHGHPDLLAHGFQVLIQTAAGAGLFPFLVEESLLGFIEQSSRFLRPVHADDTLYPRLAVAGLKPQRTTGVLTLASTVHNQKGELVLEGEQKYLIRRREPAGPSARKVVRRWWGELLARHASGAAGEAVLEELVRAYGEPHRHYHTLDHIADLLMLLDEHAAVDSDLDAVALAVLFHDAVYAAMGPQNEQRSAALAARQLASLGFAHALVEKVARYILATRHDPGAVSDVDLALLLDLDLSILAAPEAAYRAYADAIRREHALVPDELYRMGRRSVLEGFLARERIYRTDRLHALWEERARANLAAEIAGLT